MPPKESMSLDRGLPGTIAQPADSIAWGAELQGEEYVLADMLKFVQEHRTREKERGKNPQKSSGLGFFLANVRSTVYSNVS